MKAGDILAKPPAAPAPPSREEKSRRVKIWCAACQRYHKLKRSAKEPHLRSEQKPAE